MKKLSEFLSSKAVKVVICIIAAIIVIGLAFSAGFIASRKRSGMAFCQNKNYSQTFNNKMMNSPRGGLNNSGRLNGGTMGQNGMQRNAGISGKITKMNVNSITVQGQNGVESIFTVTAQTSIKNTQGSIKISDLKIGDNVTIMSLPNSNGTAEARSINVTTATNGQ